MALQVQLAELRDFTGGLRLRADQFQLGKNESPDILNMDVDPRGGFRARRGSTKFGDTLPAAAVSLWGFHAEPAVSQPMAATAAAWFSSDGSAWTSRGSWETSGQHVVAAGLNNMQYVMNGTDKAWRWDGASATRMTDPSDTPTSFADDFAAPSTAHTPRAAATAVFRDHLFVANLLEGGTRHSSRVRFSHPFKPEAWRTTDWFDIDPGMDGDRIVALQAFQDHLLVVKARSVHAVYGFDFQSWQVNPITPTFGVVSANAVTVSPNMAFWFNPTQGVMSWNGRAVGWPFEPLVSAIADSDIPAARLGEVCLAWMRNRLWVSVPWRDGGSRTFVYDPSVSKSGAWTMFGLQVGPMVEHTADAANPLFLAVSRATAGVVLSCEQYGTVGDWAVATGNGQPFPSHYVSSWLDFGKSAQKKRYRRPYTVYRGDPTCQISVEVFQDYNEAQKHSVYVDSITGVGAGAVWGTDLWDSGATWSGVATKHQIVRGSPLGLANAVQLRFVGPEDSAQDWAVDSVSVPFVPKKVR